MIGIDLLLMTYYRNTTHSPDDPDADAAMERFLSSTARKYNNLYTELERLKEPTGHNKPFPILRLPREIRDEICIHALCATNMVIAMPILNCTHTTVNPDKPPAPGLLYVNKQIYHETIGILYSKNIFRFEEPRELFDFEEQIGATNRERVRNMCIWVGFTREDKPVPDPETLELCEFHSVPSHWIVALKACRLQQIVHLAVEAGMYTRPLFVPSMPRDLQESIEQFLARAADGMVRKLSLRGFSEEERGKFPKRWEITIKQWGGYIEEQTEEIPRVEIAEAVDEEQQVS
jgi:hypothetical protein